MRRVVCAMIAVWIAIWLIIGGRWEGDEPDSSVQSIKPTLKQKVSQFSRISTTDDPISIDVADYKDPGEEPILEQGKTQAVYAEIMSAYEISRLNHIRAYEAKNRSRDKLYKCLSDGRMSSPLDDNSSSWESRTPEHLRNSRHQLPLTKEVQEAIWKWQHPQSCKASRFLVWRLWNAGLGADLHTLAQALSFAMSTNRILIIDTSAVWWYAMDRHPATLECFFVPPSNCSLSDIGNLNEIDILEPTFKYNDKKKNMIAFGRRSVEEGGATTVANPLRSYGDVANSWKSIPRQEWKEYGYQWWMSQSIRYLLRTMQPWFIEKYHHWVRVTFPDGIPKKIIGIHVRHGDKYKEMRLLSFSKYMSIAEDLRRKDPELTSIFLSTEDPSVIKEASEYSINVWKFYFTNNIRSNEGSPREYALLIGTSLLGEISFVNLFIQEQCSHWIGTDSSNWNRLINELRLTSGKYNNTYVQINKQRCHGTPGLETNGWIKGC